MCSHSLRISRQSRSGFCSRNTFCVCVFEWVPLVSPPKRAKRPPHYQPPWWAFCPVWWPGVSVRPRHFAVRQVTVNQQCNHGRSAPVKAVGARKHISPIKTGVFIGWRLCHIHGQSNECLWCIQSVKCLSNEGASSHYCTNHMIWP